MTVVKSSPDSVNHRVDSAYKQIPTFSSSAVQYYPLSWKDVVTRQDNLPDWKERIKNGENASTWYEASSFRVRSRNGTMQYYRHYLNNNWQQWDITGRFMSMQHNPTLLALPTASDIEVARSRAEIQFAKKFRKKTRHWQSGVFAGEVFQLARMLASPVKSLRDGVDLLYKDLLYSTKLASQDRGRKRSRRLTKRHIGEAIAGTYLEWTYGMKPTFSDLISSGTAFRALASGREFDMLRINAIAGYERQEIALEQFIASSAMAAMPYTYQESRKKYHVDVSLRGAWKSELACKQLPIPMMFGLSVGDILPTAWELVPWSFLIDYFTNVGDVLDTLGMWNQNFIWLNQTTRIYTQELIVPPANFRDRRVQPDGSREWFVSTIRPTLIERKSVSRFPYDNSWTPSFQTTMPGKKSLKWLNIAALAYMRKAPSHISRLG